MAAGVRLQGVIASVLVFGSLFEIVLDETTAGRRSRIAAAEAGGEQPA